MDLEEFVCSLNTSANVLLFRPPWSASIMTSLNQIGIFLKPQPHLCCTMACHKGKDNCNSTWNTWVFHDLVLLFMELKIWDVDKINSWFFVGLEAFVWLVYYSLSHLSFKILFYSTSSLLVLAPLFSFPFLFLLSLSPPVIFFAFLYFPLLSLTFLLFSFAFLFFPFLSFHFLSFPLLSLLLLCFFLVIIPYFINSFAFFILPCQNCQNSG